MKAIILQGSKVVSTKVNDLNEKVKSIIDRAWGKMDFFFNRTYGGILGEKLEIDGHVPLILPLMIMVLFFLIYGPTMGYRGLWARIIFWTSSLVFVLGLLYFTKKQKHERELKLPNKYRSGIRVLWLQISLISLVCGLVTVFAIFVTGNPGESQNTLYLHLLVPLFFFLAVIPIAIARSALSRLLFKSLRDNYSELFKDRLKKVELFEKPQPYPKVTIGTLLLSFINMPLRYPLHLLFVPAVVVLILPYALREYIKVIALIILLTTWISLSLASIVSKLDAIIIQIRRFLFKGGQLIVSLVVIIFAMGTLLEIGYILTVVEGAKWTLGRYFITAYFCFWFYEYWINRILSEELIGFFRTAYDPIGQAHYPIDPGAVSSEVKASKRVLQIHGFARLAAIGYKKGKKNIPGNEDFRIYEPMDLFRRLNEGALPISPHRIERLRRINKTIQSRIKSYYGILALVVIIIFGFGIWQLSKLEQVPGVTITIKRQEQKADSTPLVNLREQIFPETQDNNKNKIILLAASGGGTRAALYTASVLHGLAEIGVLGNVVLASGVSGGGAAIAYFAAHRDLLMTSKSGKHWFRFYNTMSKPYIKEVLEGAAEERIMRGTRLGKLLDESFQRHFGKNPSIQIPVNDKKKIGLIFNTALAGHLHRGVGPHSESFKDWAKKNRNLTKSDLAGSRLIFTNLEQIKAFPSDALEAYKLRYVVINSHEVNLTTAAALNANFPPVFSNAAVDVEYENTPKGDRYWVTDGGATDNRGIISLLFALRKSIQDQLIEKKGAAIKPDIHIIVAEASAGSIDYHQDRGVGSKFGASEKFASQLMEELEAQVELLYQKIPGRKSSITIHYLAMPAALRFRGGLGTHWMMPELVRIVDPYENNPDRAKDLLLRKLDILNVIANLHQPKDKKDLFETDGRLDWLPVNWNGNKCEVLKLIEDKDLHGQRWQDLVNSLMDSNES
jgi:hypothetical protein